MITAEELLRDLRAVEPDPARRERKLAEMVVTLQDGADRMAARAADTAAALAKAVHNAEAAVAIVKAARRGAGS